MTKSTPPQPNKPDGSHDDGDVTPVDDRQAVKNQGETTPEAYPKDDGGRPDYGSPARHD